MNFLIDRAADTIAIDNAILTGIDCSSLASNITSVIWNGAQGEVEYNDRPPVRALFTDPSPYFALLNTWMTAAAAAALPLTAAQAQAIKSSFVDALFNFKRTATISFSGHVYDTSDESADALKTAFLAVLAGNTDSAVAVPINVAFASLTAAINATTGAGLGADGGGSNSYPRTSILYALNQFCDSAASANINPAAITPPSPSINISTNVSWVDTSGVTWTVAADGLLAAIASRRATLQAMRVTKKAALAALGTVAAVVAYDITAGW